LNRYQANDEQGEDHSIGAENDLAEFFGEHFEFIREEE
jgi:hypothetical protein